MYIQCTFLIEQQHYYLSYLRVHTVDTYMCNYSSIYIKTTDTSNITRTIYEHIVHIHMYISSTKVYIDW